MKKQNRCYDDIRHKKNHLALLQVVIIALAVLFSLSVGRYPIKITEIFNALFAKSFNDEAFVIFIHLRLSRTVLVMFSGASLALAGAVYQTLFRNPLASPDILGVSSGASLGAAVAIMLAHTSVIWIQLFAFVGGITTVFLSVRLSKGANRLAHAGLIITGIIISSLANSGIMLLKYLADPYQQLPKIEYWLMGGFYGADWPKAVLVAISFIASALTLYAIRWQITILTLEYDEAVSLGVNVRLIRNVLIICATLLTASVVSCAGLVSWIGLMAPHIAEKITRNNISGKLALSVSLGMALLLLADTVARSITSSELPVSIIISFFCAPFLFLFMNKTIKGRSGE